VRGHSASSAARLPRGQRLENASTPSGLLAIDLHQLAVARAGPLGQRQIDGAAGLGGTPTTTAQ